MNEKIIMSVEGKGMKENGMYIFSFQEDTPWENRISFDTENERMTPHLIRTEGKQTYVLTKKHFVTFETDYFFQKREQVFPLQTETLFKEGLLDVDIETGSRVSGLVDHKLTRWSLAFFDTSVLLGVYHADSLLKEFDEGILFYGKRKINKTLEKEGDFIFKDWNFKRVFGQGCTGSFSFIGDSVFFPQGKQYVKLSLAEIIKENSKLQKDILFQMSGEITAYDHKKGFALADNQGNYIVKGERKNPLSSSGNVKTYIQSGERFFLPSEATSVLFQQYKDESYVIFGVDAGKIIVYALDSIKSFSTMQYKTTLSLISTTQAKNERKEEKDNHIYNLRMIGDDFVCFSFCDMFFNIGLEQLISTSSNQYITSEDEKKYANSEEYKKMIKGKYGFSGIKSAPHRILSWEFVGAS